MRWVGIDEAGYGPNLGPMVMTAVMAETAGAKQSDSEPPAKRTLDFWADLAATVDRAGGDPDRLWVDDSKAIFRGGKRRERLEAACLAVVHAIRDNLPSDLGELLGFLGIGTLEDAELSTWCRPGDRTGSSPGLKTPAGLSDVLARRPLVPRRASWRLCAVRSVLVAPAQFNAELNKLGCKSEVHFAAFARLLHVVWDRAEDGQQTFVTSDKHGGKHYYLRSLCRAFPDAWIERGPEGAGLSRYRMRGPARVLELSLLPQAEVSDGLVALASIVSKTIRELWMDVFNAYWRARVPQLRPTAGYAVDAVRFRGEIEAAVGPEGPDPSLWWRNK